MLQVEASSPQGIVVGAVGIAGRKIGVKVIKLGGKYGDDAIKYLSKTKYGKKLKWLNKGTGNDVLFVQKGVSQFFSK